MLSRMRASGVPSLRLSTSPHTVMRVLRMQASPPQTFRVFCTQLCLWVVSVAIWHLLWSDYSRMADKHGNRRGRAQFSFMGAGLVTDLDGLILLGWHFISHLSSGKSG